MEGCAFCSKTEIHQAFNIKWYGLSDRRKDQRLVMLYKIEQDKAAILKINKLKKNQKIKALLTSYQNQRQILS